jgi:hypothetical protein
MPQVNSSPHSSPKLVVLCTPRSDCPGSCPLRESRRGWCQFPNRERRAIVQQRDIEEFFLLKNAKCAAAKRFAEARKDYEKRPGRSVGKYGYDREAKELEQLRKEKAEALKNFRRKETYLKRLLAGGATVESGIHTVEIERRQRVGAMSPVEYDQLRVS